MTEEDEDLFSPMGDPETFGEAAWPAPAAGVAMAAAVHEPVLTELSEEALAEGGCPMQGVPPTSAEVDSDGDSADGFFLHGAGIEQDDDNDDVIEAGATSWEQRDAALRAEAIDIDDEDEIVSTLGDGEAMGAGGGGGGDGDRDDDVWSRSSGSSPEPDGKDGVW